MATDEELMALAQTRAQERLGFYIHFSFYIVINILLFLIWMFVAGDGFAWFLFPLVFWGIGITAHYYGAFIVPKRAR
ncbi:MAG: 2TM domain-containing protein [Halobacteriota archaeon]